MAKRLSMKRKFGSSKMGGFIPKGGKKGASGSKCSKTGSFRVSGRSMTKKAGFKMSFTKAEAELINRVAKAAAHRLR